MSVSARRRDSSASARFAVTSRWSTQAKPRWRRLPLSRAIARDQALPSGSALHRRVTPLPLQIALPAIFESAYSSLQFPL